MNYGRRLGRPETLDSHYNGNGQPEEQCENEIVYSPSRDWIYSFLSPSGQIRQEYLIKSPDKAYQHD